MVETSLFAEEVELVGPKLQVPLRRMRGFFSEFLFCMSCFMIIVRTQEFDYGILHATKLIPFSDAKGTCPNESSKSFSSHNRCVMRYPRHLIERRI